MKSLIPALLLAAAVGLKAEAQSTTLPRSWRLEDCIRYAVEHHRNIHIQQRNNRNARLTTAEAYAAFLPSVSASTGAQFSFGRTIDPETNTYNTVSNFSNAYGVNASVPLFHSGALINNVRLARVQEKMGLKSLEQARDNVALQTLQVYTEALYLREVLRYRTGKTDESRRQLQRLRRMHELGRSSAAELALVEAQWAADRHSLVEDEQRLETALLNLKICLCLPPETELRAEWLSEPHTGTAPDDSPTTDAETLFRAAEQSLPATVNARHTIAANRYSLHQAIGALFPLLSLSGGLSSGYFKTLERGDFAPFRRQFRDKLGYYVGVSMSIPLFNRLNGIGNVKRQRNRLRDAEDEYAQKRDELNRDVRLAVMEQQTAWRSVEALQHQLTADSLAYALTARRFEEGLTGAVELQTAAANLMRSQASLLQSRLTLFVKRTLTDYYNGQKPYTL